MIEIKNMHNEKPKEPWDFRVDRHSPVGNPFIMHGEGQRNKVCNEYDRWFNMEIKYNKMMQSYTQGMIKAYKEYGKLNLFCWCAPKRCHAETIREYITEEVKNGK